MQEEEQHKATCDGLMEAAITLAQRRGKVLDLTHADIAKEAGEPVEAAYRCYADERALRLGLLQYLLDLARAAVIESLPGSQPGLSRIRTAYTTYLEANLRHRALRELALHFRCDADGSERLRSRAHGVMLITQVELRNAGWRSAAPAARLLTTMVLDVALAEYEAGGPLPALRAAMFDYLDLPTADSQSNPIP